MVMIKQTNVSFKPPITSNTTKAYYGSAIIIKNAGAGNVTINRAWTLVPGEVLEFHTSDDENIILIQATFIFAGGSGRVEIICSLPDGDEYENYTPR